MPNQDESPERSEEETRFRFGQSTRRTFLSRIGMASLLATAGPAITTLGQRSEKLEQGLSAESKGRRVNSCLCFAAMYQGDEITTVEGLGQPENLHPMQAAFVASDAYQCGYCTSGQIMSAVALLKEPCGPEEAEVKEFMSGNICRCGAYQNIVAAIQSVRQGTKPQKAG